MNVIFLICMQIFIRIYFFIHWIGSFLSRGAAPGNVLHEILLEATVLMERSGFLVHAITSDGAQPNRTMWSKFGISNSKVHCDHVYSEDRKLWFISDFPHLIKCMRNWMTKRKKNTNTLREFKVAITALVFCNV